MIEYNKTVAFANTSGGTIYIGVQDNGEVIGIDDPDFVMQQIVNSIRDSTRPDISMFTNIELMKEKDKRYLKISINQELTFEALEKEMKIRNLDFSAVQMKNLGILSTDDIYTNLGLLVSDQCGHSIKFAVFQGADKRVFKDRKELEGSLFTQLTDAYKTIDFYNGT